MKVVLDLSRLLRDGKITQEEFDRLSRLAAQDTGSFAVNILIGLGVIAVSAGLVALVMNIIAVGVIGAVVLAGGLAFTYMGATQWKVLATICLLVGALMLAGGALALGEGNIVSLLVATAVLTGAGIAGRSSLLIALAVLALSACLGASTGYAHAVYELSIQEPTLTIVLFGALALVAYLASRHIGPTYEPLALTAARVSLFLVNFGFWIGSLWGDPLVLLRTLTRSVTGPGIPRDVVVPPMVFVIGWAVALFAVAAWAVKANRRWVVNLAAVFGAIHFYTQWFERLGPTPVSVLVGGVLVLGFAVAAWKLNQKVAPVAA
jgi:iron complex transport system permease protein